MKLRVGLFDEFWRDQESTTRFRPLPPDFEYVRDCADPSRVDVVMATQISARQVVDLPHPRRVLYLQETSEAYGNRDVDLYKRFDLVLSNDKFLVEHPDLAGKVRYMTLFGAWSCPDEDSVSVAKSRLVSFVSSRCARLSGHRIRQRAIRSDLPGVEKFGTWDDGPWVLPKVYLEPYMFTIAVENSNYPWWHTEKLFSAWYHGCIPIYWGCEDWSQMAAHGYLEDAVIRWRSGTLDELREILNSLDWMTYMNKMSALTRNRRLVLGNNVGEIPLRTQLCGFFGL